MNKNYLFILIAVVAIVLAVMFSNSIIAAITLDQIIRNNDCDGMSKWEKTITSETDFLLISESQMNNAADLSDECLWKIIDSNKSNVPIDQMVVLDEILKKRNCDGLTTWLIDNPDLDNITGLTNLIIHEMASLSKECGY